MSNLSTRRVPSSLVVLCLLAIASFVGGCASDTHPATESSAESLSATSASSSSALAAPTCTPGATRECKKFWNDIHGRLHCDLETEICRADGYAWLACGDHDGGVTPDAGAESTDTDAGDGQD